jgi:hypothetical protein
VIVAEPITTVPASLRFRPEDVPRADFRKVIPSLNQVGFSNRKLAIVCQCSEGAIRKWAAGETEPVYSKAIVLLAMWDIYCRPFSESKVEPSTP